MNGSIDIWYTKVVDVTSGEFLFGRTIAFQDGIIVTIENVPPPWDGAVLNAAGNYLCSGLIDSHDHIFLHAGDAPRVSYLESNDEGKLATAQGNARIAWNAALR